MKNNLADLANMLFDQMGRLDDIDLKNTKTLQSEIARTNAKLDLSKGILEIGKLQLQAQEQLKLTKLNHEIVPELIEPKRTEKLGLPPKRD